MKPKIAEGPFHAFYDPMKAVYDGLMAKYGGDFDIVRAEMPKVNYVVDSLPSRIQKAMKTTAELLFFSSDTLAKQLSHHPELTQQEYVGVFCGIKGYTGNVYDRGQGSAGLVIEAGGRCYRVILKPTLNLLEVYLVSISSLNADTLREFLNSKPII